MVAAPLMAAPLVVAPLAAGGGGADAAGGMKAPAAMASGRTDGGRRQLGRRGRWLAGRRRGRPLTGPTNAMAPSSAARGTHRRTMSRVAARSGGWGAADPPKAEATQPSGRRRRPPAQAPTRCRRLSQRDGNVASTGWRRAALTTAASTAGAGTGGDGRCRQQPRRHQERRGRPPAAPLASRAPVVGHAPRPVWRSVPADRLHSGIQGCHRHPTCAAGGVLVELGPWTAAQMRRYVRNLLASR